MTKTRISKGPSSIIAATLLLVLGLTGCQTSNSFYPDQFVDISQDAAIMDLRALKRPQDRIEIAALANPQYYTELQGLSGPDFTSTLLYLGLVPGWTWVARPDGVSFREAHERWTIVESGRVVPDVISTLKTKKGPVQVSLVRTSSDSCFFASTYRDPSLEGFRTAIHGYSCRRGSSFEFEEVVEIIEKIEIAPNEYTGAGVRRDAVTGSNSEPE